MKNYKIFREDFDLLNPNKEILKCSFYQIQDESILLPRPCIIYLHCNSGSRIEAKPILSYLLTIGINVFTFDFSGCGNSQGRYITLGYKEIQDVKTIVDYLKAKSDKVSKIGLWGRSMGAVTALNYASIDKELTVLIIDSPFSDLNLIAEELTRSKTNFPKIFIPTLLAILKKSIKKKVPIKFNELNLTKKVANIRIPCFFLYSFHDEIVNPAHTEKLFHLYGSPDKKMVSVRGLHNDPRPVNIMKEAGKFCFDFFLKNDENFKKINSKLEIIDLYKRHSTKINSFNLGNNGLNSGELEKNIKKINTIEFFQNIDDETPNITSNISFLSQNDVKFFGVLNEKNSQMIYLTKSNEINLDDINLLKFVSINNI